MLLLKLQIKYNDASPRMVVRAKDNRKKETQFLIFLKPIGSVDTVYNVMKENKTL